MRSSSMRAAVCAGDRRLDVRDLPVPEPGRNEVLLAVTRCGICGTDLHFVFDEYAEPGVVLGHEYSATVAALGPDVDAGDLAIGVDVVVSPRPGCGTCRACRRGRPSVCHRQVRPSGHSGAFAEFVVADAARVMPLPPSVTARTAALTEPTAIALHAVALAEVEPADRVLVTGGGPVGQLVVAVLAHRGVDAITVSEPSVTRRTLVRRLGATRTVVPSDLPEPRTGVPVAEPFDVVFECSGRADAIETGSAQLDRAGALVLIGTGREYPRVNHNRMIVFENTVIGAYNYGADGFAGALALLADPAFPADALIEPNDIGLSEIETTMRALAAGSIGGKVLVDPRQP